MMNCLICKKSNECEDKYLYSELKFETDTLRKKIKRTSPLRIRAYCKAFEQDDKSKVETFIKEYESKWIK